MSLTIDNNMGADGDHLYNALLDAHSGLSTEQSHRMNARLVLILMNQVGDKSCIEEAIALAAKEFNECPQN